MCYVLLRVDTNMGEGGVISTDTQMGFQQGYT